MIKQTLNYCLLRNFCRLFVSHICVQRTAFPANDDVVVVHQELSFLYFLTCNPFC